MRGFESTRDQQYLAWRDAKRAAASTALRPVDIRTPEVLERDEHEALTEQLRHLNIALYRTDAPMNGERLLALCAQFGLVRVDLHQCADSSGIVELRDDHRAGFIPYSTRALKWHTDGYYRPLNDPVRAFALHCLCSASEGGDSYFFDHELAFIELAEHDERLVHALMHHDALTIPEHVVDDRTLRPAVSGPVFSITHEGRLHMRYTSRPRHVEWSTSAPVAAAREFLQRLLASRPRSLIHHRLNPGEGLLCANVLHCRDAYSDNADASGRSLLRVRFLDAPALERP